MKPIVIPRLPAVGHVLAGGLLLMHVALCVPAATSRGFPSLHPFWETVARYISFFGFVLFPFFDNRLQFRRFIWYWFVPLACMMNGVVGTNLGDATPRIGNSVGITGILTGDTGSVIFIGLLQMAAWFPIGWGADAIGAALWDACRGFTDPDRGEGSFRFSTTALLGFVLVSAGICGVAISSVHIYEAWPGRHWDDECRHNLGQIATAMLNYEAKYRTLPPAYVADASGRPIHSWRVLLLPFLGQQALYDAYRFDEPWDSPRNRQLVGKMPSVYGCRWDDGRKAGHTSYVVISGDGTAFPGSKAVSLRQIRDGTSSTILGGECSGSGITWTEPRDLPFDQMQALVGSPTAIGMRTIHDRFHNGFSVVFADGTWRYMGKDIRPDLLRALITINGGERFDEQEF
jgi:hypothetical protein